MRRVLMMKRVLLMLMMLTTVNLRAQGSLGHASVGIAFEKGRGPMLHLAVGAEKFIGESDFGWGGEVGLLALRKVEPSPLALGSLNMFYHVPLGQDPRRWDPYITGGGALVTNFGGGAAGWTYGGGLNRWKDTAIGVRVEFRHIPFRAFTDGFDLFIIRAGAVFR
jgi:hypothetical protein